MTIYIIAIILWLIIIYLTQIYKFLQYNKLFIVILLLPIIFSVINVFNRNSIGETSQNGQQTSSFIFLAAFIFFGFMFLKEEKSIEERQILKLVLWSLMLLLLIMFPLDSNIKVIPYMYSITLLILAVAYYIFYNGMLDNSGWVFNISSDPHIT